MSILTILLCAILVTQGTNEKPDKAWNWIDDKTATAYYLFKCRSKNYEVQMVRPAEKDNPDHWDCQIRVLKGGELRHQWYTNDGGTFWIEDNLLVYDRHSDTATGCELFVFNLEKRQQLWTKFLKGLGPIDHWSYRNKINLSVREGRIKVLGNESYGQYIEIVDLVSGKTIEHRIGGKAGKRFVDKADK